MDPASRMDRLAEELCCKVDLVFTTAVDHWVWPSPATTTGRGAAMVTRAA